MGTKKKDKKPVIEQKGLFEIVRNEKGIAIGYRDWPKEEIDPKEIETPESETTTNDIISNIKKAHNKIKF